MRRILSLLTLGAALAGAAPAEAQQPRTISAGMTADEVRATFGPPAVVREADGWTYFFYTNRCLPRCGTDDTVFFRDGRVVSAVLHSPARRFSGPRAADALREATGPLPPTRPSAAPAAVSGIRVRSSAPAAPAERSTNLGVIRGRNAGFMTPADTASAAEGPAAGEAPAGPDAARQQREQEVQPNTVRPGSPQPAPAPPAAAPARPAPPQPRADGVEANTVRRAPRP